MACSTTPRTTQSRLEAAAAYRVGDGQEDLVYEEAKACMASKDTEGARSLMAQLPDGYRNTDRYRQQCDMYDALCATGVVTRDGSSGLRSVVARILGVDDSGYDRTISRYADALVVHGYTATTVEHCTLFEADDVVEVTKMSVGHATRFRKYVDANTSCLTRACFAAHTALSKCAPVASALFTKRGGAGLVDGD